MKSRLAVSLLFILIASTFKSDATAAFKRLRSWTVMVVDCGAARAGGRITSHNSKVASATRVKEEGEITLIQADAGRVLLKQNCAAEKFITTAAGRMGEVLDLMRLK